LFHSLLSALLGALFFALASTLAHASF
jgi:hypothetical protein